MLDSSRPYPGIETLLADLADAGRPMAVVTNKPQSFSDRILEKLDLAPHFRFVLGEGILPERKPDPAPLLHALEKCAPGTPPSEAVLIGDSWVDVRAARNAGMQPETILFSGVGKTTDEMAEALGGGLLQFNLESIEEASRQDVKHL